MPVVERPPSEPITFTEDFDSTVPIERAPMAGRIETDWDRPAAVDASLVVAVDDAIECHPMVRSDSRSTEVHDVTRIRCEARYH